MPYTYADIKAEFNLDDDGDPWGTAYHWLFRIADSITFHHGFDTPDAWKFRPSPCGRGDDPAECSTAAFCDECDPEALEKFGNVLSRYIDKMRLAGMSY